MPKKTQKVKRNNGSVSKATVDTIPGRPLTQREKNAVNDRKLEVQVQLATDAKKFIDGFQDVRDALEDTGKEALFARTNARTFILANLPLLQDRIFPALNKNHGLKTEDQTPLLGVTSKKEFCENLMKVSDSYVRRMSRENSKTFEYPDGTVVTRALTEEEKDAAAKKKEKEKAAASVTCGRYGDLLLEKTQKAIQESPYSKEDQLKITGKQILDLQQLEAELQLDVAGQQLKAAEKGRETAKRELEAAEKQLEAAERELELETKGAAA
jgi:hypothetical protein